MNPPRGRGRTLRRVLPHPLLFVLAAAAPAVASIPEPAAAQTPASVRAVCVESGGSWDRCTDAAVAARALMADAGLVAGLGSEIAGSASTLGRRIGGRPRLAWSLRVSGALAELPDVFAEPDLRAGTISYLLPAFHLGLGAGLLDGFSPLPTVGGVLALDALASVAWTVPPGGRGFGGGTTGYTLGLRAGLLRESFTLPGATVSLSRRYPGTLEIGDTGVGDPTHLGVDPVVTSVRVTLGKHLYGVGVTAGTGWDRYGADVVLELSEDGGTGVLLPTSLDARRRLWFGGLSMTFLLLQVSLEGGWATGLDAVEGPPASSYDPRRGTAWGGLALRFTP